MLPLLTPLLLVAYNAPAGGPPPGQQRPAITPIVAQAQLTVNQWMRAFDTATAAVFEFEHLRSFEFERQHWIEERKYWEDPRIHNFGNMGWRGLLHACVVPIFTHAIDRFAYSGVDARKLVHESEIPADAEVVDLCCGVGFSTPRHGGSVTAVDASDEMLTIAKMRRGDVACFEKGNAETWGSAQCCDIVSTKPSTAQPYIPMPPVTFCGPFPCDASLTELNR